MASLPMVASGGGKVASGTFKLSTSAQTTLDLGFEPIFFCAYYRPSQNNNVRVEFLYDKDYSTTNFLYVDYSGPVVLGGRNFGTSTNTQIYSINNNGVTMNKGDSTTSAYDWHYFAIGE